MLSLLILLAAAACSVLSLVGYVASGLWDNWRDRRACRRGDHLWTDRGDYPDLTVECRVCHTPGTREDLNARFRRITGG